MPVPGSSRRARAWPPRAALALALVAIGMPAAAQAPPVAACTAALAGTYLADIRTEAGAFASRALVTLHADGTLAVVDSRQHQGVQGSSFSAQRGSWRCAGARAARGVTLNFGFPPQDGIARSDWVIARDAGRDTVSGTIAVHVFAGVAGVDPFGRGGRPLGAFRFTGARVAPMR
jgi:hypothetical protein